MGELTRLGVVLVSLGGVCFVASIISFGYAESSAKRSFPASLHRKHGRSLRDELAKAAILLPTVGAWLLIISALNRILHGGG